MTSSESSTRGSFSRTGSANDLRVVSTAVGCTSRAGGLHVSASGDSEHDSVVVVVAVGPSPSLTDAISDVDVDVIRHCTSELRGALSLRLSSYDNFTDMRRQQSVANSQLNWNYIINDKFLNVTRPSSARQLPRLVTAHRRTLCQFAGRQHNSCIYRPTQSSQCDKPLCGQQTCPLTAHCPALLTLPAGETCKLEQNWVCWEESSVLSHAVASSCIQRRVSYTLSTVHIRTCAGVQPGFFYWLYGFYHYFLLFILDRGWTWLWHCDTELFTYSEKLFSCYCLHEETKQKSTANRPFVGASAGKRFCELDLWTRDIEN